MTQRHFHGTKHFKGGCDIDEGQISPNANYWLMAARFEYGRLVDVLGEEKANHVAPERAEGQTWKSVYESYKLIADLAEKQVARAGLIEDGQDVFISRVGGVDFYADMDALKKSNQEIKARYIASLRRQGVNGNTQADALEVTG